MNRRDLFKLAGKLGAGLGLAAVVGTTVRDEEDELLTMARTGLAQVEAGERGVPWREARSTNTTYTYHSGKVPAFASGPTLNRTSGQTIYVDAGTPSSFPGDYAGQGFSQVEIASDGKVTYWYPPRKRQGGAL